MPNHVSSAAGASPNSAASVTASIGTATALPFRDASFDIVFCSFGALQFVSDIALAVADLGSIDGGRVAIGVGVAIFFLLYGAFAIVEFILLRRYVIKGPPTDDEPMAGQPSPPRPAKVA